MRVALHEARTIATQLLLDAGVSVEMSSAMVEVLLKAELMGHRTHGLAQLPTYLQRLANGEIKTAGEIEVLNDDPQCFAWQAHRLPGPWVMNQAVDSLMARVKERPIVMGTVANCTHIGSLQAYIEAPARAGYIALMMVTDPGVASVAPFGGSTPILTSNPIACGIPTGGEPLLIDQCTSLISNAAAGNYARENRQFPGAWVVDNQGIPSRDPGVLATDPPGTLMPLGGADFGYKGFGLMLMVEAFALALSGHGRADPKMRGAQGVFLQLIDPAALSGRDYFINEMNWLVDQCRNSAPAQGSEGVRMPGERAQSLEREQREQGIELSKALWMQLTGLLTS